MEGSIGIGVCVMQKLSAKFSEDPERFYSLQSMVNSELRQGTQQAKNSSTDALLWLKRYVQNVKGFNLYYEPTKNHATKNH